MQATEQVQQYANTVHREAFDLARTGGIPESLRGTAVEILAAGIVDQCNNGNMDEGELQAFVLWNLELHAANTQIRLPDLGTAG